MIPNPQCSKQCFANLWAVVIAYHPNVRSLNELCLRLKLYGAQVVVVDNTEHPKLRSLDLPEDTQLNSLYINTGIAHAQNVGICKALAGGASAIIFFDQDSTFDNDFLSELVGKLRSGVPDVVAPRCFDNETDIELPSQRLSPVWGVRSVYCSADLEPYPVDIVISSGTTVTREAIELVGQMDEDLFIDFVDTEWCLRCRSKQVPIRVIPTAVMRHRIGVRSICEGPLQIIVHSPLRCYYQIRNSFHLFRRSHVPRIFAAKEMLSVLLNRLLLLRHVSDRASYLKAYFQGVRDGLFGVIGARKAQ